MYTTEHRLTFCCRYVSVSYRIDTARYQDSLSLCEVVVQGSTQVPEGYGELGGMAGCRLPGSSDYPMMCSNDLK